MANLTKFFLTFLLLFAFLIGKSEDGYELWLRYKPVDNQVLLNEYCKAIKEVVVFGQSETTEVIKSEIARGLSAMLVQPYSVSSVVSSENVLVIGTPSNSEFIRSLNLVSRLDRLGNEGYLIVETTSKGKKNIVIASNSEVGTLYGAFHFLRLIQSNKSVVALNIEEKPQTTHRLLNHWDNLDRTIERGYAGFSIWDWHKLPDYIDPRYTDYARANASIGINGTVITNVNANALVLTDQYIKKVAALAKVFRPYGIKIYLTARFSAPVEIGGLKTADPLDAQVADWWKTKVEEIYKAIPDFGGFLVKANSEGQPGPQNYGRNHADGANMLAKALAPHGGVVMWRAFVYDHNVPDDRAKQAYTEFNPLDGKFDENVFVQVKNGAIDFQPREPFHPLFGAMPKTPLMMEFQITQEYTGCATHLVYLAPLFEECLDADTHAKGKGSTVAKVIDGSLDNHLYSGMAGVSNIGNDRNWTGHPFAQSNWYAYGRLAWNPNLSSEDIADEWIRQTFSNDSKVIDVLKPMMMQSREAMVDYMTPLGLHHIMARNHHWGPGPWVDGGRPDWTSLYYHRADSLGIGFNRSSTGSNAVAQYYEPVRQQFDKLENCPENLLLWFHHVPWTYKLKNGQTLWNAICDQYYRGTDAVKQMQKQWQGLKGSIDDQRFDHVSQLLQIQVNESVWWRNACLLYFQQFSKMPIPEKYEKPDKTLEYYQNLQFRYVPGIEN
ncbi:MAG TPA: alpha-glucuronidase family glycosyl hydrolase [Prolixibacteraceae bacterium]|nr:alpha-glucuronidase family glycosyl hydrolase [Prolixibacteraceae bacterium]